MSLFIDRKKRMPGIIVDESMKSNESFLLEISTLFCMPTKGAKAEQDRREKKTCKVEARAPPKFFFFIFFLTPKMPPRNQIVGVHTVGIP